MKMKELEKIAKANAVSPRGKTKASLIREIQRAEGNFDCFGSADDYCDQICYLFRSDCLNEDGAMGSKKSNNRW